MTKIIVVRHGESQGNAKNIFLGYTDMDLTELGEMQAAKTAHYLKENFVIDEIYASDLLRAYNTAVPTAKAFEKEIIKVKNLREIYAGDWEAADYYGLYEKDTTAFTKWMTDIDNAACTNGESIADMKARVVSAVDEIAKQNEGKTIAIFCHATPIKALFSAWEKVPMQEIDWVKNASVTLVEYDGVDDVKFLKTDFAEHLAGMVTFLPDKV